MLLRSLTLGFQELQAHLLSWGCVHCCETLVRALVQGVKYTPLYIMIMTRSICNTGTVRLETY